MSSALVKGTRVVRVGTGVSPRRPTRCNVAYQTSLGLQADALQLCEVARDPATGHTVLVARKEIPAGGTLLTIPDSRWLSLATASQDLRAICQDQPAWVQLSLHLIAQLSDPASPWKGCLDDLKRNRGRPVALWTDEELRELEGTQVLITARDYRSYFQSKFQQLQASLIPRLPAALQAHCTLDNFVWAAATTKANLFSPFTDSDPAVIPVANLANHSRRPNSQWVVKSAGFLSRSRNLEVQATRPISAGDAISLDYAPDKVESQVALEFGAFDAVEPRLGFVLTLEVSRSDPYYDDKLDIVEQQRMESSQEFTLAANQPPSQELLAYLRLLNLDGPDAFLLEGLFRNEVWGHMCDPVSEDNERAVCQSMANGCRAALAAYPTTLAEDIKAFDSAEAQAGSARDIALRLRMAEKRILEDLSVWFETREKKLAELEYYQERRLKRLGLLNEDGDSTFEDMIRINI